VTVLELFAAVLLAGGSVLVLWVVRQADAAVPPLRTAEPPAPVLRPVQEPPLRRAA